jgi:hypothetical protein
MYFWVFVILLTILPIVFSENIMKTHKITQTINLDGTLYPRRRTWWNISTLDTFFEWQMNSMVDTDHAPFPREFEHLPLHYMVMRLEMFELFENMDQPEFVGRKVTVLWRETNNTSFLVTGHDKESFHKNPLILYIENPHYQYMKYNGTIYLLKEKDPLLPSLYLWSSTVIAVLSIVMMAILAFYDYKRIGTPGKAIENLDTGIFHVYCLPFSGFFPSSIVCEKLLEEDKNEYHLQIGSLNNFTKNQLWWNYVVLSPFFMMWFLYLVHLVILYEFHTTVAIYFLLWIIVAITTTIMRTRYCMQVYSQLLSKRDHEPDSKIMIEWHFDFAWKAYISMKPLKPLF